MKKSLKMSLQVFGVAGLVILSACNQTPTEVDIEETGVSESLSPDFNSEEDIMMDEDVMQGEEEPMMDPEENAISIPVPYSSPAGDHEFLVGITLDDGVVTAAGAVMEEDLEHPAVIKWQTAFVENFTEAVVGKSLTELQDVEAIGGASLATEGFKEAIAKI